MDQSILVTRSTRYSQVVSQLQLCMAGQIRPSKERVHGRQAWPVKCSQDIATTTVEKQKTTYRNKTIATYRNNNYIMWHIQSIKMPWFAIDDCRMLNYSLVSKWYVSLDVSNALKINNQNSSFLFMKTLLQICSIDHSTTASYIGFALHEIRAC